MPREYFDYVYTIEEENADGVCQTLQRIFVKEEELQQMGEQARKFVVKEKTVISKQRGCESFWIQLL